MLINNLLGFLRENEHIEYPSVLEKVFQLSNYLKCGGFAKIPALMIQQVDYGMKPEQISIIVAEIKNRSRNEGNSIDAQLN
jgi:hypothetical protein